MDGMTFCRMRRRGKVGGGCFFRFILSSCVMDNS